MVLWNTGDASSSSESFQPTARGLLAALQHPPKPSARRRSGVPGRRRPRAGGAVRVLVVDLGRLLAPPARLPFRRPRHELLLLALVALVALLPVNEASDPDASRLCLSQALVHARLTVSPCIGDSVDWSSYHGRVYSDKAPGMSVLSIPFVEAVRLRPPSQWPVSGDLRVWVVHVLTTGVAFVLLAAPSAARMRGSRPGGGERRWSASAWGRWPGLWPRAASARFRRRRRRLRCLPAPGAAPSAPSPALRPGWRSRSTIRRRRSRPSSRSTPPWPAAGCCSVTWPVPCRRWRCSGPTTGRPSDHRSTCPTSTWARPRRPRASRRVCSGLASPVGRRSRRCSGRSRAAAGLAGAGGGGGRARGRRAAVADRGARLRPGRRHLPSRRLQLLPTVWRNLARPSLPGRDAAVPGAGAWARVQALAASHRAAGGRLDPGHDRCHADLVGGAALPGNGMATDPGCPHRGERLRARPPALQQPPHLGRSRAGGGRRLQSGVVQAATALLLARRPAALAAGAIRLDPGAGRRHPWSARSPEL